MIGAQLHQHAARNGDKLAIVCGNERVRWNDLTALVDSTAHWLTKVTPPGSGIALYLPNCAALPLLILAIARAGRVAHVLDPGWPMPLAGQTITAIGSALIISSVEMEHLSSGSIVIDANDSLDTLRKVIEGNQQYHHETFVPCDDPALPFYIGFTSGSTGQPKGYRRTQLSWTESFVIEAREFGHTSDDIILAPGSLSHSLFLYAAIHALHIGATIILSRSFRPAHVLDAIRQYRATILYAVPAQLILLSGQMHDAQDTSVDRLRYVISSGAKWREDDRARLRALLPRTCFAEFYGASEMSFVTVAKQDEDVPAGSVGRAFDHVGIRITGAENQQLAPLRIGEIFVSSPMLFEHYAGGGSEADIKRDGHYISVGDMGYLDSNGFLFLTGRKDRMIVTAGKNLFPEEVESVLLSHPDIVDVAIIALADEKRGSRIVAVLTAKAGATPLSAELITFARRTLPLYKIPRRYFQVPDWPRTRSGKTDFSVLQENFAAGLYRQLS